MCDSWLIQKHVEIVATDHRRSAVRRCYDGCLIWWESSVLHNANAHNGTIAAFTLSVVVHQVMHTRRWLRQASVREHLQCVFLQFSPMKVLRKIARPTRRIEYVVRWDRSHFHHKIQWCARFYVGAKRVFQLLWSTTTDAHYDAWPAVHKLRALFSNTRTERRPFSKELARRLVWLVSHSSAR